MWTLSGRATASPISSMRRSLWRRAFLGGFSAPGLPQRASRRHADIFGSPSLINASTRRRYVSSLSNVAMGPSNKATSMPTLDDIDRGGKDGEVVFPRSSDGSVGEIDMSLFTPDRIRNFCIVAHIDHGKTSLSNSMMRLTGCLHRSKDDGTDSGDDLYLDKLQVEKERGITVKANTTSLFYRHRSKVYLLNLIDTPGHVDFAYEVTRSLRACDTAVIVVDATQGIQAQTVANYMHAFDQELGMIPVLNKIDMPSARVAQVSREVEDALGFNTEEVLHASAKTGQGVSAVLERVIDGGEPSGGARAAPFRGFLFDSWYDEFRGVVCIIKVVDGCVRRGDTVASAHTHQSYVIESLGIMYPERHPTDALYPGQVGFFVGGMRRAEEAKSGDTFIKPEEYAAPTAPNTHSAGKHGDGDGDDSSTGSPSPVPLPGFVEAKPMVFTGLYPVDSSLITRLGEALEKLCLTDASVQYTRESSDALGIGFRAGFLGALHMDVVLERLQHEHALDVIATAPTVPYRVLLHSGDTVEVTAPSSFPKDEEIEQAYEPYASVRIIVPNDILYMMQNVCRERRGQQDGENEWVDRERTRMHWRLPLSEVIADFVSKVKSVSRGYASVEYEPAGYEPSQLVKLNVLLNGEPTEALSTIVPKESAYQVGRDLVSRLKGEIKRQLYPVAVQAAIGNKVVARETVKAVRKDVTAKCYGGDITRKRKLLEKQKEGRRRLKQIGGVELTQNAFLAVLRRGGSN